MNDSDGAERGGKTCLYNGDTQLSTAATENAFFSVSPPPSKYTGSHTTALAW